MSMVKLIRSVADRGGDALGHRRQRRPSFDVLEDRCTPAAVHLAAAVVPIRGIPAVPPMMTASPIFLYPIRPLPVAVPPPAPEIPFHSRPVFTLSPNRPGVRDQPISLALVPPSTRQAKGDLQVFLATDTIGNVPTTLRMSEGDQLVLDVVARYGTQAAEHPQFGIEPVEGAVLPEGMMLDPKTGMLAWSATPGIYAFRISVREGMSRASVMIHLRVRQRASEHPNGGEPRGSDGARGSSMGGQAGGGEGGSSVQPAPR